MHMYRLQCNYFSVFVHYSREPEEQSQKFYGPYIVEYKSLVFLRKEIELVAFLLKLILFMILFSYCLNSDEQLNVWNSNIYSQM